MKCVSPAWVSLGKAFLLCREMQQLLSTLCLSSRTQMKCLIPSKFDNKAGVLKVITFQGIMAFYLSREIMFGFSNLCFPQFPQKKDRSICSLLAARYGWDKAKCGLIHECGLIFSCSWPFTGPRFSGILCHLCPGKAGPAPAAPEPGETAPKSTGWALFYLSEHQD